MTGQRTGALVRAYYSRSDGKSGPSRQEREDAGDSLSSTNADHDVDSPLDFNPDQTP